MFFRPSGILRHEMVLSWPVWRGISAAIASVLVVLLLVRHVFEDRLREKVRRGIDLVTVPLFGFFMFYIASDFLDVLP